MTDKLPTGPILIHRADILDGLRALYLAQQRFDRHMKEDSYACGYREGFDDALAAIAQLLGVAEEFEAAHQRLQAGPPPPLSLYDSRPD